ncbi:uncharacterized protein LOC142817324 [Rhipicephalus microplus]|uniref:uncharacterized protein LOC142817324 n=1 Tax=Rhipicephalus microplus TaxID=6941 RepID=UPI003F6CD10A
MSELGSSLPLTPLAPMPSADSPASTAGQGLPHLPGKKHKKKTHKGLGDESSSEEAALGKNSRQAKQQLASAMHAISKQGADIVEKLQSSISPEDKSDSSPSPGEDEEGSAEASRTKGECCPRMRCGCLFLWFVLLLAAFGIAIAYLLFPDEVSDVLCQLGLNKLAGQGPAGESNELKASKVLDEADEEEWGHSIFDVRQDAEDPPSSDSLQDYDVDELSDNETNSTSSVVVMRASNTTVTPRSTSPALISSNYVRTPFFLVTGMLNNVEGIEGMSGVNDPDSKIDFDSFIDVAAFGRPAFKPSALKIPVSTRRNVWRATANSTTVALSDVTRRHPRESFSC